LLAHKPRAEVEQLLARTRLTRYTRHTTMQKREIIRIIAEARAKGYSTNYEELQDGLVSVSVPVFNRAGVVVSIRRGAFGKEIAHRNLLCCVSILPLDIVN